jgi:hypothetical protein
MTSRRRRLPRRSESRGDGVSGGGGSAPRAAMAGQGVLTGVLAGLGALIMSLSGQSTLDGVLVNAGALAPATLSGQGTLTGTIVDLFASILTLAAGESCFTADYYIVDGTSGKVLDWVDWNNPALFFEQPLTANQVAVPAAHADYGGKLCATFTGVEFYHYSGGVTLCRGLHNGTGKRQVLVFTPTTLTGNNTYLATRSGSSTIGYSMAINGSAQINVNVSNGTSNIFGLNAPGALAAGTPTYLETHYLEGGGSPEGEIFVKGSSLDTSDSSGTPSAADSTNTMCLGAFPTGSSVAQFRWRSLFPLMPNLTAAQQALMRAYILSDTGIAP